jgi:hypothetical protein
MPATQAKRGSDDRCGCDDPDEMADADPTTSWQQLGRHDVAMATIQRFAERAGAVRVAVLLDRGPEHEPPLLACEPGQAFTISQGGQDFVLAADALAGVAPLPVDPPPSVPASAIDVDAERGEVAAPLGVIEALVRAVEELARVLGGRTVAMADFATRSGEPLSVAARPGEPVVLAIGEHEFEYDPPDG